MLKSIPMVLVVALFSLDAAGAPDAPQSMQVGGGKLIPLLFVQTRYDDNIFSQATSEESDLIVNLRPSVQWLQEKNANSVALTYTGDWGLYRDNQDDDYNDHTFSFDSHWEPTDKFRGDLGASYGFFHDNRGEGASEGVIGLSRAEPDEYELGNVNVQIDFGRDSAMFGASLIAYVNDIEYQNNRIETQFRDRDETYMAGRLYGRLSGGKTRFFVEVSHEDFEYDTPPIVGGPLDSTQQGWAVGVQWEATAKTSGAIKVGEVEKEFDFGGRGEETITSWDVDITWSPRTYSSFYLSASNTPRESNGTGSFIEQRNYSITWLHGWTDLLTTTASVGIGDDEFSASSRQDDRESYRVGLSYSLRRWLTLGASFTHTERDSSRQHFDFDRNAIAVSLDMSL